MLKKAFASVLIGSAALVSLVEQAQAQPHIYETGTIQSMVVEGSSQISVYLSGTDDLSLCSGGGRWTIDPSDPMRDKKYAMLMSASAQGKEVRLMHLGSAPCGQWESHVIYLIRVSY